MNFIAKNCLILIKLKVECTYSKIARKNIPSGSGLYDKLNYWLAIWVEEIANLASTRSTWPHNDMDVIHHFKAITKRRRSSEGPIKTSEYKFDKFDQLIMAKPLKLNINY